MDPEELARLRDQALEALRQGVSLESINSKLQSMSGGDIQTLENLQQLAAGQSPQEQEALQREAERGSSPVGNFARTVAQGLTLGFGDELAGAGAALKTALPGGRPIREAGQAAQEATQSSRQRVEDLRQLNPGATLAGEVAGAVAGGAGVAGLLGRLGKGAGTARSLLTSGARTTPARAVGRAARRGAAAGGAEEFVRGAGEAEGGLLPRALAGLKKAPVGAGLGGFAGGLLAFPGQARRAFRETKQAGEQVADDLLDTAVQGERRLPSQLRARAQEKADEARRIFQNLEQTENVQAPRVRQIFQENPRAQAALSPQARETLEAGGELSFTQVDDAASNLKRVADAFKRGDGSVRAEDVRTASAAFDELDSAMRESLEGFEDAKRLWGEKSRAMRALSEGRDTFGKQADDVRSAMRQFSNDPEAQEFFRLGQINEATRKLERFRGSFKEPPTAVKNYFNRGRGFEEELRLLFPNDEAFEEFARRVDITRASASAGQKAAILAQAIAFASPLGTSLFGRLIG